MEVTMDLMQAMHSFLQFPPPIDTSPLDGLQQCRGNRSGIHRVAIDEAENAFRMSDQLADAAARCFVW